MSAAEDRSPERYTGGSDRYVNFVQDYLGLRLAATQEAILRAVAENQRVLIVSGNGVGKSYAVAALILAFLYTNEDSTVMGTSGTYSQFIDTMWRPLKEMWKTATEDYGLPGRKLEASPQIEIDDDWYAKVVSPKDPGNVEGRHADNILVVIEEADKSYITEEHFDSAGSSITDPTDRMVAIANPPVDESNVVYEKMSAESRWEVVQFSSFESHNVAVDLDGGEPIPGLVDLLTLADDWEAWNREPWPRTPHDYPGASSLIEKVNLGEMPREQALEMLKPGFSEIREAHRTRDDLDERWYRRRAGIIPPDSAAVYRPFNVAEVEASFERLTDDFTRPDGVGIDIARMGGDSNALAAVHDDELRIHEVWDGVDHNTNFQLISRRLNAWRGVPTAVDAQGEGSGVSDRLNQRHDGVTRFNAGGTAANDKEFYDRWAEGLYHLGKFLKGGGVFGSERLRDELLAAARVVEFDEKYYKSRNSTVLKATSKDEIRQKLGHSPDVLDAAYMAVWVAEAGENAFQRVVW